jgi:hypothetical protein
MFSAIAYLRTRDRLSSSDRGDKNVYTYAAERQ